MRILVDENLSPMIAAALRISGHDVLMVTAAMPAAPDDDVVKLAIADARTCH